MRVKVIFTGDTDELGKKVEGIAVAAHDWYNGIGGMPTLLHKLREAAGEFFAYIDANTKVDPSLCTPDEPTCSNCGRGLAHDLRCPEVPESDAERVAREVMERTYQEGLELAARRAYAYAAAQGRPELVNLETGEPMPSPAELREATPPVLSPVVIDRLLTPQPGEPGYTVPVDPVELRTFHPETGAPVHAPVVIASGGDAAEGEPMPATGRGGRPR